MTIQNYQKEKLEIKENLDALQEKGLLRSQESLDLMVRYAELQSAELIGNPESLSELYKLDLVEDDETIFIGDFNKKLDTLYIFTHSGVDVPRAEKYLEMYNLENWQSFAHALYSNRDAGALKVIPEMIEVAKNSYQNYNFGIVMYKYNRNAADSNRVRPAEQIYDNPYKGISLWKQGVDKNTLFKELLNPFFQKLVRLIKQTQPNFMFHPHTYDTCSGEGHTAHSHDLHSGKRPTGMIFNHYEFETEAFGVYGKKNDSANFDFLTPDQIKDIQMIQNKKIQPLLPKHERAACTVDFPYISPRQLPGVFKSYFGIPQLVLEYRKDLFVRGFDQIVESLLEIGFVISNKY